jgi:hypothetical protein
MNASVNTLHSVQTWTIHAIGYGLDDREVGVRVPVGSKNFLFSTSSRQALESTQPPIQLAPGVKRPGREAGHSPPFSEQVKMDLYIHSPIPLRGVVLNYFTYAYSCCTLLQMAIRLGTVIVGF